MFFMLAWAMKCSVIWFDPSELKWNDNECNYTRLMLSLTKFADNFMLDPMMVVNTAEFRMTCVSLQCGFLVW